MFETLNTSAAYPPAASHPNAQLTKLYDTQPYTAYAEDVECMWHWTIYQDQKLVQEGCSLSLDSSRHAVKHVMAFFNMSGKISQPEQ
jgi:methane monooxygenase component D